MQLRVGYELIYDCPQPTPMMLMLNIHHTRASDIVVPDVLTTNPVGAADVLSRRVRQLVHANRRAGGPDPADRQRDRERLGRSRTGACCRTASTPCEDLPEECLLFLLGSRYCETDRLSDVAWSLFEQPPTGALRVQAICDYVHQPHHVRLRERALDEDGVGSASPRSRASAATTRIWRSRSAAA